MCGEEKGVTWRGNEIYMIEFVMGKDGHEGLGSGQGWSNYYWWIG